MNLIEKFGIAAFARLARRGSLSLQLPSGAETTLGKGAPTASLVTNDYRSLKGIFRTGLVGFSEAYMERRIDTPDLPGLLAWGVANQSAWFDHPFARATLPVRRFFQRVRPERRHARVKSMDDHYNIGNDFYAAWLDETMTYSSARFTSPDQCLPQAQLNKYRAMADHAALKPGMRVLEIGCGWGGFAEYAAAERGCEVVGITLSEEHASFARKRMANQGLADRVDIRIEDFRGVQGEFDAVVSIEMIESVDETNWGPLFQTISRSLRPGAFAAMQVITIGDDEWERYRSRADFIQQYIFPGGQLPAPKVLRSLAKRSGLAVEQVETFGLDYARTLAMWRTSFHERWAELRDDHNLDDRFCRMWDLYLSLCEAGFRTGRIDVEQWVFSGGSPR